MKETARVKIERLELDGHVAVSISDKEVRVWVCSSETEANIFRLKAMGKVHRAGQDVMVIPK